MGIFSPGSQIYQKEQTPVSTHALVLWAWGGWGGGPGRWGQGSHQFIRWYNLVGKQTCPRGRQQQVQVVKTLLNLGEKAIVSFNLATGFIQLVYIYMWPKVQRIGFQLEIQIQ